MKKITKITRLFFAIAMMISQFMMPLNTVFAENVEESSDYYYVSGEKSIFNITMKGYLTYDETNDIYVLSNNSNKNVMFSALTYYSEAYVIDYCINDNNKCEELVANSDNVLSMTKDLSQENINEITFNLYHTYEQEVETPNDEEESEESSEKEEESQTTEDADASDTETPEEEPEMETVKVLIDSITIDIKDNIESDEEEVENDATPSEAEENTTKEDESSNNNSSTSEISTNTDVNTNENTNKVTEEEIPEVTVSGGNKVLNVAISNNIEVSEEGTYSIAVGEEVELNAMYTYGTMKVYLNATDITNEDNIYKYTFDEERVNQFDFVICDENNEFVDSLRIEINSYLPVGNTYDDNNNIKEVSISNGSINFDSNTTSYVINVASDVNEITINGILDSEYATASGFGTYALTGNKTMISVTVMAQDGTTKTYTFEVDREEKKEESKETNTLLENRVYSSDAYLTSLTIEGYEIDFNKYTNEYTITVSNDVTSLDISAVLSSNYATYAVYGNSDFQVGENTVSIVVKAEDGTINTYKIIVNKEDKKTEKTTTTEKEDTKKESSNSVIKTIIIILIVLVIIGLIYLIFKDDDEEDKNEEYNPKKINNSSNKKKEK